MPRSQTQECYNTTEAYLRLLHFLSCNKPINVRVLAYEGLTDDHIPVHPGDKRETDRPGYGEVYVLFALECLAQQDLRQPVHQRLLLPYPGACRT